MRHLFNSKVEILESVTDIIDGARVQTWAKSSARFDNVSAPGEMKCRLDLSFLRVGKDAPAPIVAGRSPDRTGVLFCNNTPNLKAGHIIKVIEGPHTGSQFLIKMRPDEAQNRRRTHHLEVQVFEVNQAGFSYPSGAPV
jgi:hypothetical protein